MSKYSKFNKFLAIDCETTGISQGLDPSKDHQSISWGLVVSDVNTFLPIDELYLEIKWDGKSNWDEKAYKIHGMSKDYLEKNGLNEIEAVEEISNFILENFDIDDTIVLMGHNVGSFDVFFLKKLLYKNGIMLNFSHRYLDTFSAGFAAFQTFDSNELFELLEMQRSEYHDALEDAKFSLEVFRRIRELML